MTTRTADARPECCASVRCAAAPIDDDRNNEGMAILTDAQQGLLNRWLGVWTQSADLSWPLQDTTVLRVAAKGASYIVKASSGSHHIAREIAAHEQFLGRFSGWVPRLVHASAPDGVLVTEHLPGELVQGTSAEWEPEVYRQAGQRLDQLLIAGESSASYVGDLIDKTRKGIADAAGLVPHDELAALERELASIRVGSVTLSFTHGDFQPRNWLVDDGRLRVIDFGRAAQRYWTSDLVRLLSQQFVGRTDLRDAFLAGLKRPLTTEDAMMMHLERIQQSVGTVVWAHSIGDAAFEDQGRVMIGSILNGPRW
jgi:aminoglycoside phosphotransferase